jgi:preprotein translocase subunit Sec63
VVVVVILWIVWLLTLEQVNNIEPMKSFDPFQILGIATDADTSTIKRAYRKLSLSKHPDKNPDDPLAVTEFIQITKAYTVIIIPFISKDSY